MKGSINAVMDLTGNLNRHIITDDVKDICNSSPSQAAGTISSCLVRSNNETTTIPSLCIQDPVGLETQSQPANLDERKSLKLGKRKPLSPLRRSDTNESFGYSSSSGIKKAITSSSLSAKRKRLTAPKYRMLLKPSEAKVSVNATFLGDGLTSHCSPCSSPCSRLRRFYCTSGMFDIKPKDIENWSYKPKPEVIEDLIPEDSIKSSFTDNQDIEQREIAHTHLCQQRKDVPVDLLYKEKLEPMSFGHQNRIEDQFYVPREEEWSALSEHHVTKGQVKDSQSRVPRDDIAKDHMNTRSSNTLSSEGEELEDGEIKECHEGQVCSEEPALNDLELATLSETTHILVPTNDIAKDKLDNGKSKTFPSEDEELEEGEIREYCDGQLCSVEPALACQALASPFDIHIEVHDDHKLLNDEFLNTRINLVEQLHRNRLNTLLLEQKEEVTKFKRQMDDERRKLRREHHLDLELIHCTHINRKDRHAARKLLRQEYSKLIDQFDEYVKRQRRKLMHIQIDARIKEKELKNKRLEEVKTSKLLESFDKNPLATTGFEKFKFREQVEAHCDKSKNTQILSERTLNLKTGALSSTELSGVCADVPANLQNDGLHVISTDIETQACMSGGMNKVKSDELHKVSCETSATDVCEVEGEKTLDAGPLPQNCIMHIQADQLHKVNVNSTTTMDLTIPSSEVKEVVGDGRLELKPIEAEKETPVLQSKVIKFPVDSVESNRMSPDIAETFVPGGESYKPLEMETQTSQCNMIGPSGEELHSVIDASNKVKLREKEQGEDLNLPYTTSGTTLGTYQPRCADSDGVCLKSRFHSCIGLSSFAHASSQCKYLASTTQKLHHQSGCENKSEKFTTNECQIQVAKTKSKQIKRELKITHNLVHENEGLAGKFRDKFCKYKDRASPGSQGLCSSSIHRSRFQRPGLASPPAQRNSLSPVQWRTPFARPIPTTRNVALLTGNAAISCIDPLIPPHVNIQNVHEPRAPAPHLHPFRFTCRPEKPFLLQNGETMKQQESLPCEGPSTSLPCHGSFPSSAAEDPQKLHHQSGCENKSEKFRTNECQIQVVKTKSKQIKWELKTTRNLIHKNEGLAGDFRDKLCKYKDSASPGSQGLCSSSIHRSQSQRPGLASPPAQQRNSLSPVQWRSPFARPIPTTLDVALFTGNAAMSCIDPLIPPHVNIQNVREPRAPAPHLHPLRFTCRPEKPFLLQNGETMKQQESLPSEGPSTSLFPSSAAQDPPQVRAVIPNSSRLVDRGPVFQRWMTSYLVRNSDGECASKL